MRVLIIEDEQLAANRLAMIIQEVDPTIEIVHQTDTVRESVEYLTNNQSRLDLIFCDIHLADGRSFEIFEQVEVTSPIIFTTAYDEYSIKAFKVNSVDYLLKPIKKEEVSQALEKYTKLFKQNEKADLSHLRELFETTLKPNQKRFLVKSGIKLIPIKMEEIGLIYLDNKITHLLDIQEGRNYLLDFTLEELISRELDPKSFFRINRSQIVNMEAIEAIRPYINQRLSVSLKLTTNQELIVSREKVNDFKKWFLR